MALRHIPATIREAMTEWNRDRAPRLAAALAFYTIFSFAPLLVIATGVASLVFGADAAQGQIVGQLRQLIGEAGAQVVETGLKHAHQSGTGLVATIIGFITLLLGASGVFGELHDALNTVWGIETPTNAGWMSAVKNRFLSFAMCFAVGFLLLVSLIVSAALAAVTSYLEIFGFSFPPLLIAAETGLNVAIITVLFAMMFRFLPDAKIAWRDVWFGAFVTSILFNAGKYGIGLYLGRASVTDPFGAAGSLVVFLLWIYYSGLIFYFGAEITESTAKRAGRWSVTNGSTRGMPTTMSETAGSRRLAAKSV